MEEMHEQMTQEDIKTKREVAKRLLKGKGVDKDESKAVSILEECVAFGDVDSMLTLAKCCAFAHGMEQNVERAMELVSNAAEKGNEEAHGLMKLINDWKGNQSIVLSCLLSTFFPLPYTNKI